MTHDEAEEHGSDGHQEQLDQDAESPSEEAEGSESREDGSKSSDDSATDEEDHEEKDVSEMGEFEGAKKAEKKPRDQQEMGGNILVGQTDAEDKDETGARKDTVNESDEFAKHRLTDAFPSRQLLKNLYRRIKCLVSRQECQTARQNTRS